MRVLFDTNVLISYLLTPKTGTINTIVEAAFERKFQLLLPNEVVTELKKKIAKKSYLSEKISKSSIQKFTNAFSTIAEVLLPITQPIPKIGRDFKDDYLLAYSVVGDADYLVTGDKDLLVLRQVYKVKIVNPSKFLKVLKSNI